MMPQAFFAVEFIRGGKASTLKGAGARNMMHNSPTGRDRFLRVEDEEVLSWNI